MVVGSEVGFDVEGALVVGELVGIVGLEHPAVSLTSATTASLHKPLVSSNATQKNAPPLQANSALL